jgi:hypothetical protein
VHHFTQENIEATLTLHSEAAETLDRCQARILMLQHQRDVNTQALDEAEELEVLLLDRCKFKGVLSYPPLDQEKYREKIV